MYYLIILIFNIILGLSIGLLIGKQINKKIKYKGPDSNEIKKKIYKDEKGKFKWKTRICVCPIFHSFIKLKDENYKDEH